MIVFGGILYKGVEYGDQDILKLVGKRAIYGIDWVYAGDCFFEECNIYAEHNGEVFDKGYGRNALKDFFLWHNQQLAVL